MHWKQVDSLSFLQSSVSHNCVRACKGKRCNTGYGSGKKQLFLSLFVCVLIALYLFPDGRGRSLHFFYIFYFFLHFLHLHLCIYQTLLSKATYSASGYTFVLSVCVFPGNRTQNLCATTTELYHWATGTILDNVYLIIKVYLLIKAARIDVVQVRELGSHNSLCTLSRKIYPRKIFSYIVYSWYTTQ